MERKGENVDKKTSVELSALQQDLEELKKKLKDNEMASNAKEDVEEIRQTISKDLGRYVGRAFFEEMKKDMKENDLGSKAKQHVEGHTQRLAKRCPK